MATVESLTERFERQRPRLRAIAQRMLGSGVDADDALQEAWLRIHDRGSEGVVNPDAWLTTVVARVCLNMLRARRARPEVLADTHVPDPLVVLPAGDDPEHEVMLGDAVGPALLVVLDTLAPAERFAFVLHDVFGVRFAEIASALDRSEAAVQQLASRARRRVRNAPTPDQDVTRQRRIVDAFFAASRDGNFDALLAILHDDVELRIDGGTRRADASLVLRGAHAVAGHTATYASLAPFVRPAVVNGTPGAVVVRQGQLFSVMAFTIPDDRITAIAALLDPVRLARIELARV